MERVPRRPCIPLYESEGKDARERPYAGMTDFQVRFCALPFPVQNYIMMGFTLNNPAINEEAKKQIKTERLEQLTAIQKEPELSAHLLTFANYMSEGARKEDAKNGKTKRHP